MRGWARMGVEFTHTSGWCTLAGRGAFGFGRTLPGLLEHRIRSLPQRVAAKAGRKTLDHISAPKLTDTSRSFAV